MALMKNIPLIRTEKGTTSCLVSNINPHQKEYNIIVKTGNYKIIQSSGECFFKVLDVLLHYFICTSSCEWHSTISAPSFACVV